MSNHADLLLELAETSSSITRSVQLREAAEYIADLERQLAELRQPTAQQVEDARDAAPTLKVLSKDEAHLRLHQAINAIKIGNKTDDKLIFRELRKLGVVLAALQAGKEKEHGN